MDTTELERLASHIQAFSGNYREIKLAHAVIVLITERRKVAEMVRGLKVEHCDMNGGCSSRYIHHSADGTESRGNCDCFATWHNAAVDAVLKLLK